MIENGMLSGAAQYYDDRATHAREQAIAARGYTHDFLAALRCQPGLDISDDDVCQELCSLTLEEAEQLRQAMCHCRRGHKHESMLALDQCIESIAQRYGSAVAERDV